MNLRTLLRHTLIFTGVYAFMHCKSDIARVTLPQQNDHSAQIFALRYGKSTYPAKLVNHEQKAGKVPLDWLFYLVQDSRGYNILVDTGFQTEKYARQFGIKHFQTASQLLRQVNLTPDDITDIIITHGHFDHIEGVAQFQTARVYIQKSEYAQFKRSADYAAHRDYFLKAEADNRIRHELDATLTQSRDYYQMILTGGHTKGSQVFIMNAETKIIFTGDECYFAAYCSEQYTLPGGARYSFENNQKAVRLFQEKTLLTPHDTQIFGNESGQVKSVLTVYFRKSQG